MKLQWLADLPPITVTSAAAGQSYVRIFFGLELVLIYFENELTCFIHRYDHGKLPLACQILQKNNAKSSKTKLRQTESNSNYIPAYCRINLTMQSIKGGESSSQFRWFTIAKIEL